MVPCEAMATLPHFSPDDDFEPLPPAVARLRAALAATDAILFSTPEYAMPMPFEKSLNSSGERSRAASSGPK